MADKNTHFPQYRKLCNDRCFYQILDERKFEEIQLIGSKAVLHLVNAVQYPEILRVKDMLAANWPYLESDKMEFEQMRARTK